VTAIVRTDNKHRTDRTDKIRGKQED